jgi:hypothetical protein
MDTPLTCAVKKALFSMLLKDIYIYIGLYKYNLCMSFGNVKDEMKINKAADCATDSGNRMQLRRNNCVGLLTCHLYDLPCGTS